MSDSRITIVSNRLPVSPVQKDDGRWKLQASNGGLVSALDPILRKRGGNWVGWSGHAGSMPPGMQDAFVTTSQERGYTLKPVAMTQSEITGYYSGFSNQTIWPLFHNMVGRCIFEKRHWAAYRQVNEKFASVLLDYARDGKEIWVHDYHLMLVAKELREKGGRAKLGFFLHIPFPPPDTYMLIPWRREILSALLEYDLLGFQTSQDLTNFRDCAAQLNVIESGHNGYATGPLESERRGDPKNNAGPQDTHTPVCNAFPISIDFEKINHLSKSDETRDLVNRLAGDLSGQKIIFGAERLDYTKGLLHRMRGYRRLLREHPELHRKITFLQYVVPGRESIPEYSLLRNDIEHLVGEIEGEFNRPGWAPIQYMYRKLNLKELVAFYRFCDIALITPLKDGMNLVAKEFCAARSDEDGLLILSEFAGAANEFREGALLVNPYSEEAMADIIYEACTMPEDQRKKRMQGLRNQVRHSTIYHWVDSFLETLSAVERTDSDTL